MGPIVLHGVVFLAEQWQTPWGKIELTNRVSCGQVQTEQSLAVYRELALSDIADEYEAAMQIFPVR